MSSNRFLNDAGYKKNVLRPFWSEHILILASNLLDDLAGYCTRCWKSIVNQNFEDNAHLLDSTIITEESSENQIFNSLDTIIFPLRKVVGFSIDLWYCKMT